MKQCNTHKNSIRILRIHHPGIPGIPGSPGSPGSPDAPTAQHDNHICFRHGRRNQNRSHSKRQKKTAGFCENISFWRLLQILLFLVQLYCRFLPRFNNFSVGQNHPRFSYLSPISGSGRLNPGLPGEQCKMGTWNPGAKQET